MMELVRVLETHRGRDKIVRLCGYVLMWIGGSGRGKFHEKLRIIAGELSACRTVLRLFDDLPMLAANCMYGLGAKEKNTVVRLMTIATNNIFQLYFPVEHVAWLSQRKILPYNGATWMVGCVGLWAVSLVAEIIKMVAKIVSLKKQLTDVKKQQVLSSSEESSGDTGQVMREEERKLGEDLQVSYLTLLQSIADIVNAVNWLPAGFLWAGKVPPSYSGMFGTISTLLMLIKIWPKKNLTKSA